MRSQAAQLMSTSTAPPASTALANVSIAPGSPRLTATASPARRLPATSRAPASLRSATITRAPSESSSRAIADPIPPAAPVTTARRPSRESPSTTMIIIGR